MAHVRTPLPAGTIIDYCGERAEVLPGDSGGPFINVRVDGCDTRWSWSFEGENCTVVSTPHGEFDPWIARVAQELGAEDVVPASYRSYYDRGLSPADAVLQERLDAGLLQLAPEYAAFERYDFGPGVTVEAADGWERSSGSSEVSRAVYVRYDDDAPDADTHRVIFTVRVVDGQVAEAWASTGKGEQFGHLPKSTLTEHAPSTRRKRRP